MIGHSYPALKKSIGQLNDVNLSTLSLERQGPVPLDSSTCNYIDGMVRRSPVIHMAMTNLINDALNVKPDFFWGTTKVDVTSVMEDEMNTYIIPCCIENIKHILCYGLGMVALVEDKDPITGASQKVVRFPRGNGAIYTYYDDKAHRQSFFYSSTSSSSFNTMSPMPDPSVTVFSGFGSDPDCRGQINSTMSSLIDENAFVLLMEKNYLTASERMAAPIVLTEAPLNGPKENEADEMRIGIYGEKRALDKGMADMYHKTEAEMMASKRTMESYNQFNKQSILIAMNGVGEAMIQNVSEAAKAAGSYDMRPLPAGSKASGAPPSHVPPEFMKLKEASHEIFAAAFGTALAQLKGQESHTAIAAKNMTENYNKKLHFIRNLAGKLMTRFYQMMHAESDAAFVVQKIRATKGTGPAADPDVGGLIKENTVTIVLPTTLNDTLSNMILKYSLGSVRKEELDDYNRQSAGLKSIPHTERNQFGADWPDQLKALALKTFSGAILAGTPLALGLDLAVGKKQDGEKREKDKARNKEKKKSDKKRKLDSRGDREKEGKGDGETKEEKGEKEEGDANETKRKKKTL